MQHEYYGPDSLATHARHLCQGCFACPIQGPSLEHVCAFIMASFVSHHPAVLPTQTLCSIQAGGGPMWQGLGTLSLAFVHIIFDARNAR